MPRPCPCPSADTWTCLMHSCSPSLACRCNRLPIGRDRSPGTRSSTSPTTRNCPCLTDNMAKCHFLSFNCPCFTCPRRFPGVLTASSCFTWSQSLQRTGCGCFVTPQWHDAGNYAMQDDNASFQCSLSLIWPSSSANRYWGTDAFLLYSMYVRARSKCG